MRGYPDEEDVLGEVLLIQAGAQPAPTLLDDDPESGNFRLSG